jgi:pyruvate-formate lyase-activating enzyme
METTKSSINHQPAHSLALNIAATCQATYALGPGLRSAVWVQGCPFRCPGCISPDWVKEISRSALFSARISTGTAHRSIRHRNYIFRW